MTYNWTGRTAIVTGAASGIGRELCLALAARGATVTGADMDAEGLDELTGIETRIVDVTDAWAVTALVAEVSRRHGRLDFMFNNAGIFAAGPMEDLDDESWRRVVDVNVWGVVNGTRAAYDVMLAQGDGHIVNTSSSAGVMPVARSAAYAATKHAVVGLTTSLRAEAARNGVRVSVVIPGLVDTQIFARSEALTGYDYERTIKKLPFSKLSPADAASAILAGVERNRQFITFPAYNRTLVRLNRLMPDLMSPIINR